MTIVVSFCNVHFIGYNFSNASRLGFTLRSNNFHFLLEVGQSYHSTQFLTHSFLVAPFSCIVFVVFCKVSAAASVFDPRLTPDQALIFVSGFCVNPVQPRNFVRVVFDHRKNFPGNHKTAAAMVKAADTLWDARGSHDPTVAAAMTQRSRSPAPNNGKRGDKWSGNAPSKSRPPSCPDFYSFQNPLQWRV